MKINNSNNYDIQSKYLENYKNKENLEAKNKDIEKDNYVKIDISESTKKLINEIKNSKEPEFSEKVEGIRKAVLDGTYTVSTQAIADKIMAAIKGQKDSDA